MTTNLDLNVFKYEPQTVQRAKRALSCSPFCLKLFQQMRQQSVPIQQIAEETGIKSGYAKLALSESRTEDKLVWLINVGLLRREVDGQGLTDSFRLTPLGRQIIDQWEQLENEIPAASLFERVSHWLNRWLKLSL
ncbi:MAG: Npun_F0494 family protein [Pleurocapsa sp.]